MRNIAPPVKFIAVAALLVNNNTDTHQQILSYKTTDPPHIEPLAELNCTCRTATALETFSSGATRF